MKIEKLKNGKYFVDISDFAQLFAKGENPFEAKDDVLRQLKEAMNDYIEDVLG